MTTSVISTPVGKIKIIHQNDILKGISFLSPDTPEHIENSAKPIIEQIEAYFDNPLHIFDLKLDLEVTAYQQKVLQAINAIPSGSTRSYKDLATELSSGARAIGNACRRNPVPLVIPCHRVVSSNGLGGFNGARLGAFLDIKIALLEHERASSSLT